MTTAPTTTAPAPAATRVVPVQTRSERPRSTDPADFATPTGREVDWKLSPVERLAPLFEDAPGDGSARWTIDAPEPVRVGTLAAGQSPRGSVFEPEDRPSAIAFARTAQAHHVLLPEAAALERPIVVSVEGGGAESRETAHLVLEAAAGSVGTVVLRHEGSTRLAENVEIVVGAGAALTVIAVQQWADDALHASAHQARLAEGASLRHVVVTFGGGVVRVNPSVDLAGARSEAEMYGVSYADAGQHFESQVYVFHHGPETRADVLYKGALQGVGARSVWIGDVLIGPEATGTDSYEANRNLVLTDGARADSIPNLEIETGDIAGAGHASATGRFDDEQLFYLQARGVPEAEAKRLVVLGFLAEIAQRIPVESLQEELIAAIEAELAKEVV
ncbi:MAG: Fe-S cluster assembly protein SufD [Actinomycetales bacterium]|nr:Fe-S cluster assembly protein SufD [Actinomycetales bacterium]